VVKLGTTTHALPQKLHSKLEQQQAALSSGVSDLTIKQQQHMAESVAWLK
jgi:hypothetical protein